jgi:hypothetical protein
VDWSNEQYVRLYIRDTKTWLKLRWEGQSLFMMLLRKVDRAGVLDDIDDPVGDLALITGLPEEHVEVGFERLKKLGSIEMKGKALVIPNFIEANETPKSDRLRQLEYRQRRRDDPEYREKMAAYHREYRKNNKEKWQAQDRVHTALENGTLTKEPCEVCGEKHGVDAHHDDYSKPLDVRWLCKSHHRKHHVQTTKRDAKLRENQANDAKISQTTLPSSYPVPDPVPNLNLERDNARSNSKDEEEWGTDTDADVDIAPKKRRTPNKQRGQADTDTPDHLPLRSPEANAVLAKIQEYWPDYPYEQARVSAAKLQTAYGQKINVLEVIEAAWAGWDLGRTINDRSGLHVYLASYCNTEAGKAPRASQGPQNGKGGVPHQAEASRPSLFARIKRISDAVWEDRQIEPGWVDDWNEAMQDQAIASKVLMRVHMKEFITRLAEVGRVELGVNYKILDHSLPAEPRTPKELLEGDEAPDPEFVAQQIAQLTAMKGLE